VKGDVDLGLRVVGEQVVVVGEDVQLRCPAPVVEGVDGAQDQEVGGRGGVRRGPAQYVALGGAQGEQFVGAEAAPVELVGGVRG
jgi:hypothetical protein